MEGGKVPRIPQCRRAPPKLVPNSKIKWAPHILEEWKFSYQKTTAHIIAKHICTFLASNSQATLSLDHIKTTTKP